MRRTIRTGGGLPILTTEETEAAATGQLQVYVGQQRLELHLLAAERQEYEQAKQRGYLVVKSSRRSHLRNVWFHWCEATGHPYVYVRRGPRYAVVDMDLIAQPWRLTDEAVERLFDSGKDALWGGPQKCKRGASISGGHTVIMFQGIPNDRAHIAAALLIQEALACKPQPAPAG